MNVRAFLERKRVIAAISIAVVVVVFFILGNRPTLYLLEEQKLESSPDYFLEQVDSKSFDQNGKVVEEIIAASANHFNDSKTTVFSHPVFTRIHPEYISIATGEAGEVNDSSKNYSLSGDAKIVRTDIYQKSIEVSAENISYDDQAQTILGEVDASLKSNQLVTHSDKLFFDITNESASLNGGVTSNYEPIKN